MSTWCDFFAGWVAGSSGLLIGHPLDTVKVRQQSLGITSAVEVTKYTFKYEGFFSFYKGMLFPLLSTGLVNSVFFGVYGASLRRFSQAKEEITENGEAETHHCSGIGDRDIFLSGCIGGMAQVFLTCPVDLIKTKMQIETGDNKRLSHPHHDYRGSLDCLRKVYHEKGIKGCFRGFNITVMRDVPSSGLYFLVYEKLMKWTHSGVVRQDFEFVSTVFAGGLAGMISWAAIIPLDVMKSRIQADDAKYPRYSGVVDCFKQTYRVGGWRIFGRGFWIVCLRAFPVNAVSFLSYEAVMCNMCNATSEL